MALANVSAFTGRLTQATIPGWEACIVGQMLNTGTATPNTAYDITASTDYATLFDAKSELACFLYYYFDFFTNGKLVVIPILANALGVAPTCTITITGTPTENKNETFFISHFINKRYTIGVLTTDTPTDVATKLVAEINADTSRMVSASSVAGVITLTHLTKGTNWNNTPIGLVTNGVAGLSFTITGFSGGAIDTVLTTSILENALTTKRCNIFVPHYAFNVAKAYVESKSNVPGDVKSSVASSGIRAPKATVLAYTNTDYEKSGEAFFMADYLETTNAKIKGAGRMNIDSINIIKIQEFAWLHKRITPGEQLNEHIINTQAYNFDAGYQNLNRSTRDFLYKNITPNEEKYHLTPQERLELKNKGFYTVKYYKDGNAVINDDIITTNYVAEKAQGLYGTKSHYRSVAILQFLQGFMQKSFELFLTDKNVGGTNSTSIKNVNEIQAKAFTYELLTTFMLGRGYELISAFQDTRGSDGASYEQIFNGEIKSEQGFYFKVVNGNGTAYIPIMIDGNLESLSFTLLPSQIN